MKKLRFISNCFLTGIKSDIQNHPKTTIQENYWTNLDRI